MNDSISKLEARVEEESSQPRSDVSSDRSTSLPAAVDEIPVEVDAERSLYRRSFAYFLFGFGYDKNAIVTDEPCI